MTEWNRGFQNGWDARQSHESETAKALAFLRIEHRSFVNSTSVSLLQNDETIHQLELKLANAIEDCAKKCERRAESLFHGADVARLCARDIRSMHNPNTPKDAQ